MTVSVASVPDETLGERVRRRRMALGYSLRQLGTEAGVDRVRISSIEKGEQVTELVLSRVLTTLDRLERFHGVDDPDEVVNVLELPDGTRVTFTGSPEGVAEAAENFLRRHRQPKD